MRYIVNDLGFDGGFNYKREKTEDALGRLAPEGVDIYYDNVGGEQLDGALWRINVGARIVVCGMVSSPPPTLPPTVRYLMLWKRMLTTVYVGNETDLAVQQTAGGVDRDQESAALVGEEGDDAGFSGDGRGVWAQVRCRAPGEDAAVAGGWEHQGRVCRDRGGRKCGPGLGGFVLGQELG